MYFGRYVDLTAYLVYKGTIAVNTDFPLIADVETGWVYRVIAVVTDNAGVTYTNTLQSFIVGEEIMWVAGAWIALGPSSLPASAITTVVGSFAGRLSATDDTVQKALDTLDDSYTEHIVNLVAGDSPYTPRVGDRILADTTAGAIVLDLQAANVFLQGTFTVTKVSTDANTITIDPNAAETISGAATYIFNVPYMEIGAASDTTSAWFLK